MIQYHAPTFRPGRPIPFMRPKLGQAAVAKMTVGDWLLLGGGVIVGGAGVNTIVGEFREMTPNAITLLLGLVLAGVGITLLVDKFGKLMA